MNKCINQNGRETGITLIALIVIIIIIVILSSVVISKIGNHGLIDVTSDVAEDYEVNSYKEQIEQVVYSTIIEYSARGETPTLIDIAEALDNQEWVRSAIANTDVSISNGDIIVTVDKGYVYQVFYDSIYGKVIVDYIGKVSEGGGGEELVRNLPTLKASYEKTIASIIVEARDEKNGIEKIEIIYKGEIVEGRNNPNQEERFDASQYGTGWYQVKATSNKTGAYRYAWVKVTNISDKLTKPLISLLPEKADGENGWYRTEVTVKITTDSPSAEDIHYRIVRNGITNPEEEDIPYNGTFKITTLGQTEIYAKTTDGEKYESEESYQNVKYDNEKPTVQIPPNITTTKTPVNDWFKAGLTIEITGEDAYSKIAGYYYMIRGESPDWIHRKITEKLSIGEDEREGITEIAVKTYDNAGNESDPKTIIIQKDTIKPDVPTITFKENTGNSITVDAIGNDNQSGIGKYIFEYREVTEDTTVWHKLDNGEVESTSGKCTYTYNVAKGEYSLRVRVQDKAENEEVSQILVAHTVLNNTPTFNSNPTVAKVASSNTSLTISAQATDADGGTLTYTLYTVGTDGTEAVATEVDQNPKTANSGTGVRFTKTGLGNYSTHTFKVKVTDGIDETPSSTCSDTTYCKGSYCSGGGTSSYQCSTCGGSGGYSTSRSCGVCGGNGYILSACTGSPSYSSVERYETCGVCGGTQGYGTVTCTKCGASTSYSVLGAGTCNVFCSGRGSDSGLQHKDTKTTCTTSRLREWKCYNLA